MKIFKQLFLVSVLSVAAVLAACSPSTEDLAREVQTNMEEKLSGEQIEIIGFMLTHKGGNEYRGILETKEPHGEFTYSVEVIYDGRAFSWEIVN